MSLDWQLVFAHYYGVLEISLGIVAVFILLSSLDDLFVDCYYWVRRLGLGLGIWKQPEMPTLQQIMENPEQPLAILVPCWREDDVIAAMIEALVSTLDYRNYIIFVGTYVNDPPTIAEVERMRRRYRQLRRVEVPHPGPTCKADCLNWIIQAVFLHEQKTGIRFAGVIQHDSEDVVHPLELRLFNAMLPDYDMIQIPVVSFEREWHQLVGSTYVDELVEWHAKDMVVRHHLTGMIPSAGLGTCFSRLALVRLGETSNNQPFNPDSLTEDYDVGMRLFRLNLKIAYAKYPVAQQHIRRNWWGSGTKDAVDVVLPLCVFEYFPSTLKAAYRQKARWVLGIALVGWQQLGWQGSLSTRYFLFRDRKAIITAFASIIAYVVALQFAFLYAARELGWMGIYFPSVFSDQDIMINVLIASGVAFMVRMVQRAYFVSNTYGWRQGLLSIPRIVVCNVVNFMAVCRAWRQFLSNFFLGTPLVWDKTTHDFPSKDQLTQKLQSLTDVLLAWQLISPEQLDTANQQCALTGGSVTDFLQAAGWIEADQLAEAMAFHAEAQLPDALANTATEEAALTLSVSGAGRS